MPTKTHDAWLSSPMIGVDLRSLLGQAVEEEEVANDGGDLENAVPPADEQETPQEPQPVSGSGGEPDSKVGIAPAIIPVIIEVVPVIINALKIACKCHIHNGTNRTLQLDSVHHDNGLCAFEKAPPATIPPGDAEFVVVNKPPFTKGVLGQVEYTIDEQTHWFVRWEHSRDQVLNPFGSSDAKVEFRSNDHQPVDSKIYKILGIPDKSDNFNYSISGQGPAPSPQPVPPPSPGPTPPSGQDVKSSCLITVNNNTKVALTLADQGHDRGDFMTQPAASVPPGGSISFVSVETPHATEQGCKGFVSWEVGSPATAIWSVEWDNPEAEKNTAKAIAEPQSAGFRSIAQIGQDDENVPVVFTISGGGAGPRPGPPKPDPEPPAPEPDFNPPPGTREPTLRKGDKSPDGWVEYLQRQLNLFLGQGTVDIDGDFGSGTEKAVRAFQKQQGLLVDGTVGNQTWAALRQEKPEAPSTDGRKPHTFEEKGLQARFDVEQADAVYDPAADLLLIFVTNVGEGAIDDFKATVRITPPNTKPKTVQVKIGPPDRLGKTKTGQGNGHSIRLPDFKKTFPAKAPDARVEDYLVEAFFDPKLGSDFFKGAVQQR